MSYYLYRYYDGAAQLLYVGCSGIPVHRVEGHRNKANWFHSVRLIKIERAGNSKESALRKEWKVIAEEKPLYNVNKRRLVAKKTTRERAIDAQRRADREILIFKWHAAGESVGVIAARLELSRQRVHQILKAANE